ncbi:MAG: cellulase family glycosylhydrolase [Fibrobacteres bacterium]|nr:cellulase family glycosylhydrolase [Fibrobacterota bacterium]
MQAHRSTDPIRLRKSICALSVISVAFFLGLAPSVQAMPFSDRVTLPSGEKIFVAGFNLAWINFAGDVGDAPLNATAFQAAMKAVADSGGNTMRVWLSTNGSKDPVFGADGLVSGLGSKTIANVQQMLAIAKTNKMMIVPTLLTHNFLQSGQSGVNLDNNKKLLATDAGLKAYIDNAVVPLVTAIGKDPNLLCWEVANEPEGMVESIGWTSQRIAKADVQKFTNRIAGAIHRAIPGVLVSTGTVQASYLGWYTDDALKAAGGDADGVLDFYMVHYYGWNGTGNSPFHKGAAAWGVDKPLVVGEFASSSWSPSTASTSKMQDAESVDTLLENLYKNGYAGGMFWQYQPDAGDTWLKGFATASPSLAKFARAHVADVKFDGVSDGKLSVVASATAGGKVAATPVGRVDTGATVTITATADAGYEFAGWGGDTVAAATVNPIKVKAMKDRAILANFRPAAGANMLKNGDFTSDANWTFNVHTDSGASGTISYAAGQADITIPAAGRQNWFVQLMQGGFPLQAGATYVVSFDAWANSPRDLQVGLTTSDWVWQSGNNVSVTAAKANYQVELTALTTVTAGATGMIQFNVGDVASTLHIDNVILVAKGSSPIRFVAPALSEPDVRLSLAGGTSFWSTRVPLASAVDLVIFDLGGREVGRYRLDVGQSRGRIPARLAPGSYRARIEAMPGKD